MEEYGLLLTLDTLLKKPEVIDGIDKIVAQVQDRLAQRSGDLMAWETIPLDMYGEKLPEEIQSSWVFILRANAVTGAERHPNSHQRAMSYRESGDLQVWNDGAWRSKPLVSDSEAELEKRWVSIPINIWHQVVVADRDWVVVSFHTVPDHQLIEERPISADMTLTRQKRYLEDNRIN